MASFIRRTFNNVHPIRQAVRAKDSRFRVCSMMRCMSGGKAGDGVGTGDSISMGLLLSIQSSLYHAVYRFVTRNNLIFYFPLLIKPLMKIMHGKNNANYTITDSSGNSYPVCKVNERLYPAFGMQRLATIKDISIRDDDVMLVGYPKSGAHWVHEILHMLVTGSTTLTKYGKGIGGMIEAMPDLVLDSHPSPRVLNSHLLFDELPKGIREKGIKIVLTVRNPKDTVVSYYNHVFNLKDHYNYSGKFDDFFKLFMESEVEYGSYFDFILSWDKLLKNPEKHSVLLLEYEENKENPVDCVKRLAKYLNINITDEFAAEIAEKTSFTSMKAKREGNVHFRKGKVGDWNNWLDDQQKDEIDREWERRMKGCVYQPKYN